MSKLKDHMLEQEKYHRLDEEEHKDPYDQGDYQPDPYEELEALMGEYSSVVEQASNIVDIVFTSTLKNEALALSLRDNLNLDIATNLTKIDLVSKIAEILEPGCAEEAKIVYNELNHENALLLGGKND